MKSHTTASDKPACSICGEPLRSFRPYPYAVCRSCDARATNEEGLPARHFEETPAFNAVREQYPDEILLLPPDDGDNPVFIDGRKCWRRYRFGGWVTMLDPFDCASFSEFWERVCERPKP